MKNAFLTRVCLYMVASALALGFTNCRSTRTSPSQAPTEIAAIMQAQSQAWNRGDLESYMEPYWHSDSLMFIGKSGLTYGWDQTLQNYRKGYPT
ncbi:hypothetical protein [Rufibacter ruber]|uniref:hypothetical protein n=1 Tax=Rufibacter ruber TaxID=1783499 RepID=UPI0012902497|nr:hypothetical protein [Rufibacter ruber]